MNNIEDKIVCAECLCDTLDIDVNYHNKLPWITYVYGKEYVVQKYNYPESAKYKCTTCGYVIKTWEYKRSDK